MCLKSGCTCKSITSLCEYNKPMVNFHCHSNASLLDGVGKTEDYIKLAKQYGHPGVAITDHGNPSAIFSHYKAVKEAGLKPVIGLEFYLAVDLSLKEVNRKRELLYKDKHQSVLIQSNEGYKNFCKLNYLSFTEGFYAKPRINYDMLFEHNKGLIVTSSCAASIFNQLLNAGKKLDAEEWFKKFIHYFGDRFFGEIQFNELLNKEEYGMNQKEMNDFIIEMCNKHHVPLLIGGDTHYAYKEDAKLQDILIACQRRKDGPGLSEVATTNSETDDDESKKNKKEFFIHARHLYYHQSEDYYNFNKIFGYNYDENIITEALDNSVKLLDTIDFEFDTKTNNFPKFNTVGKTSDNLLLELSEKGLKEKIQLRTDRGEVFSEELLEKYKKRLSFELDIIKQKGYADYFLVVQDLIKWSKENGIAVGPGRGSGAGSAVVYGLGITEADPIKHNLLFERFLNPDRDAKPDLDLDYEYGSRERVRGYLENKYGKDAVFGVMTAHIYQPKSALQDCSRGLGKDTSFTSTLMREITRLDGLEETRDLRAFFDSVKLKAATPTILKWINENEEVIYWAQKMLGLVKNLGTHAGGILIAPGPIYDYIPVTRGGGEIVTAFKEADGSTKDLSELGLLKLDVLGLRTLNVIYNSVDQIKQDLGKDIINDIRYIDIENPDLYEMIRKGNTYGVFQLDGGAGYLIKSIQPTRFDDIVAISSLNRPGPAETFGMIYAKWKKNFELGQEDKCKEDEEIYPKLDFMREITKHNYYCMIHQEDLMLMLVKAADFNLGEADNFRRAIAWNKDHPKFHTIKKYYDKLEEKMLLKGYSKEDVNYFVDYCKKFSGYSFNQSHSTAYSYVGLQCVYLKKYYPAYFLCNLANLESHDKLQEVIADAIANNIKVLPISITKSIDKFKVEDNSIRIGFNALKGLGEKAAEELISLNLSSYKNIYDILTIPFKKVNSKAFQCLIDTGAFDEFGVEREKIEIIRELYKEPKIEKWFTRKHNAVTTKTKPEILNQFPEHIVMGFAEEVKSLLNPNIELVTKLIPYVTVKLQKEETKLQKEEEILGFSMKTVNKLSKLMILNEKFPHLNLKSLSLHNTSNDICYWFLLKKTALKTKTGKTYYNLDVTDNNINIKMKCWKDINLKKGMVYISQIEKNQFGYSLIINDLLTEIDLDTL